MPGSWGRWLSGRCGQHGREQRVEDGLRHEQDAQCRPENMARLFVIHRLVSVKSLGYHSPCGRRQ